MSNRLVRRDASFDEFVSANWAQLVRFVGFLGADPSTAEDVVQTTLARCVPRWGRVGQLEDPRGYVHKMVLNDWRRNRRRRWLKEIATEVLPDRGEPTSHTDETDQRRVLLDALGTLSAAQREVLVLRYFADFSEQQTADLLGIALGTVKSRCARGIASLAQSPLLKGEGR